MTIGMGLVGPGFVGAHHIDAVRRLGFADVVAVAAGSDASAQMKADALRIPKAYGRYEDLVADPDVQVVHVTTPNHLHEPIVLAALAHGKHVVCDKPLAPSAATARALLEAARQAGVVHAVTFNYRGNPMVQQARAMVAAGELGPVHYIHGGYMQDWLLTPGDYSWRLDPAKGGESSAVGDIGSHWCDLAEHVSGRRIEAVLAELTTVVPRRLGLAIRSEDLATILLRFDGGAKGCVSIGQVCAGHKNDLWLEVHGGVASAKWRQERQNELWVGHRHSPNAVVAKDPALLYAAARDYAHLPGGHQEGWSDAFSNVVRDIYAHIADGKPADAPRAPAFATFEDGYRSACLVAAILDSHRRGGVWTKVQASELAGSAR